MNKVAVIIKSWNGKTAEGHVSIQVWTPSQRLKRALKTLGMGWGLAVLSVFLPIAHFILVPCFFIGTPVVSYFMYRQGSVVLGGEGLCPSCRAHLTIVRGSDKWPLEDVCSQCHTNVIIEKK